MKRTITVIEGDGIGPEITKAVLTIFKAAKVKLNYEYCEAGGKSFDKGITTGVPIETIESIRKNGVVLKGPLGTPLGGGGKSANVTIRKTFDMFGNVCPIFSIPNLKTPYEGRPINMVVVRENVEDLYVGVEYMETDDVSKALKLISKPGCQRISHLAFDVANSYKMKKVTVATKSNILKLTEGMMKSTFEEVAKTYDGFDTSHMIIDNLAHQLVINPEQFGVVVMTNMNGDIISDLAAGLVGGLGLAASANVGHSACMFEAVHGTAPDIAGKGIANPTALLLSGIQMLQYLGMVDKASMIYHALMKTFSEGKKVTGDLKKLIPMAQVVNTNSFVQEIINNFPQEKIENTLNVLKITNHPFYKTYNINESEFVVNDLHQDVLGIDITYKSSNIQTMNIHKELAWLNYKHHMMIKVISNHGEAIWEPIGQGDHINWMPNKSESFTDVITVRILNSTMAPSKYIDKEKIKLIINEFIDKFNVINVQTLFEVKGKRGWTLFGGENK